MKRIKLHICLLLAALMWPWLSEAAPTTVRAQLTPSTIEMGRVSTLTVTLVTDKGRGGYFESDRVDTLSAMVEIAARQKPDTADLGNGRIQVTRKYLVQSFDSGMWHIAPLKYVMGTDTVTSQPATGLTLKVMPVQVNPNGDIKDYAPVVDPPRKFWDWVPQWVSDLWWLWLLLVVAVAALVAWLKWFRHGKNPLKREKKRLSPYEEAMQRLNELRSRQLWQQGQEKEYYTQLTDILREYIDRRLGINAVEMTTAQIMDSLRHNPETQLVNDQLNEILAVADFVKFAAQHPLADDNERSLQRAMNFVEATRPAPQPAQGGEPQEKKEVKR